MPTGGVKRSASSCSRQVKRLRSVASIPETQDVDEAESAEVLQEMYAAGVAAPPSDVSESDDDDESDEEVILLPVPTCHPSASEAIPTERVPLPGRLAPQPSYEQLLRAHDTLLMRVEGLELLISQFAGRTDALQDACTQNTTTMQAQAQTLQTILSVEQNTISRFNMLLAGVKKLALALAGNPALQAQ